MEAALNAGPFSARRALRLVHTADVHLGELPTVWSGAAPDADERAFVRVIDAVLEERADALLIAGDLFDSNRVAERAIRFAASQLERVSCPVVLIPGNHDCYDGTSIYRRFDFRAVGPHVHPLYAEEGETITFDELGLTVWGKGLVEHAPANRPMAGVPARHGSDVRDGRGARQGGGVRQGRGARDSREAGAEAIDRHWLVGLAHGHFVEDRRDLRSSLITPDEIAGSALDYLALGHVHVFRDVSQGTVRACYPGAPRISYAPDSGSLAIIGLDPESGVSIEMRRLAAVAPP